MIKINSLIGVIVFALLQTQAVAGDTYSLKGDAPLGSNVPRNIATGLRISPDKKYDELSDEEKKIVRSVYDSLPDTDEPPFPLNGLKSIYQQVHSLQQATLVSGVLSIDVMIASTGQPESVSIYKSPDKDMARYVAIALMNTKFKPGKCNGVPCKMAYRFDFNFITTH